MQTRIKLTGPASDSPSAPTIDATPTWAGIMPALVAALQNGTGEGQRIARVELARLAAEVDALNARQRAERDAPAPSKGEASHLKTATAALAGVLAEYAATNARDAAEGAGGHAWRAVAHARAGAFYLAASSAAARGGNDGAELTRLAAEETDKATDARTAAVRELAELESDLAASRAARATQRATIDAHGEAIRAALAALRAPHYGDSDTARDHAADAAEILAAAIS